MRRFDDPAEVLLLLRIGAFASAVPLLMRLPLPKLKRVLEPREQARFSRPPSRDRVIRNVDRVLIRGRPLVRPGCVTRAVTLYFFLRRAGEDVDLCFGMGRVNGGYTGHAWLAKDGAPFLEESDPRGRFVETYRISGSA